MAAITCKFKSYECYSTIEKAPCFVQHANEVDILIGQIAHMVHMFHHGDVLLLPHARRIVQHRDRTQHGNSVFPFQLVFRI